MESTTCAKKKRKSNFDVPPEALQNSPTDILFKYSLDSLIPNSTTSQGFKDPVYEKRLKHALEKNFEYIREYTVYHRYDLP